MGMGKPMGAPMPTQQQGGMGGKGGPKPMQSQPMQSQPMQPQPAQGGMGGKGGTQQLPAYAQPYAQALVQPQQPQGGMGGKGGFAPQQPQSAAQAEAMKAAAMSGTQPQGGMGGKGGNQPRGTLVGIGPTDMPIYSNDPNAVPYTGGSMGGYFVNGVPGPAPQRPAYTGGQQPQMTPAQIMEMMRGIPAYVPPQPVNQLQDPFYGAAIHSGMSPEQQQAAVAAAKARQQLPAQPDVAMNRFGQVAPQQVQIPQPQQPQGGFGQPGNMQYRDPYAGTPYAGTGGPGAMPPQQALLQPQARPGPPVFLQQPVQAEAPRQAQQRQIQQMANARRGLLGGMR